MKSIAFLLVALFTSQFSLAQNFDIKVIDSLLSHLDNNDKLMGSLFISEKGKTIYSRAIGFSDLKKNSKSNPESRYRIGSISKTMTAVVIMQLIEEKKLKLDTKLKKYFKKIPNAKKITIEHLLRHRSGLFNFTNAENYFSWMEEGKSDQGMIDLFIKNGTVFDPDEKYEYSNTGYVLLAMIAEKIEKEKFSKIIQKRICEPAGLKDTYDSEIIKTENGEVLSYSKLENWEEATVTNLGIAIGAGSIVSTPKDLDQFMRHLFQHKYVNLESLEQMTTMKEGYGMGLIQLPFYTKRGFGHTGGIDGFQSISLHFPEEDFYISFCGNGIIYPYNDMLIIILSQYYGMDYKFPEFKNVILTEEELIAYLGTYSTDQLPIKIKIWAANKVLHAQATGQPSFILDAQGEHIFRFDSAGLELEFKPDQDQMILRQGGMTYEMIRE